MTDTNTAISTGKDPRTGLYLPGNDVVRRHRERVQALINSIASEFACGLAGMSASDRVILERAAELLCTTPRSHWDRCRGFNAANRALAQLRRRLKPKPYQKPRRGPSVAELLTEGANGR